MSSERELKAREQLIKEGMNLSKLMLFMKRLD